MDHRYFMRLALAEAEMALKKGEVPIGAVLVRDGQVLARAHNLKETLQDPSAHAEMLAVREAAAHLGNWRLEGTSLYVTIEPCPMCAGVLVQARVKRLVYGAADLKAGAVDSLFNIVENPRLNHQVEVIAGVLEEEAKDLLRRFFQSLRSQ